MNIWCKCLANETDWYVTSIINRTCENNWMHNRKILMLFWGVDIRCLVSLSTMRKTYTNFWVTWQQIQMQWLYFTFHPWLYAQITMHHFWLTRKRAVALQAILFWEPNFKMYTRVFERPYTRKFQYFKIYCRFCSRSRNQRMFCWVKMSNTGREWDSSPAWH